MIEISNLYKYYGSSRAVGPLTARIEDGEVVGLLGLNGAGKTTTLRVLACDLLPSSGTVKVGGVDVVERPDEVRSLIGYLPDTPPLYEEMTIRRYLAFAAQVRGVSQSDVGKFVDQTIEATGLAERADDAIASLSHGFRQRVGIAQAIVHKPKLVVLDEPSSGLDPVQIKDMRALVRRLGGTHTVLVSSHNLPEISEMCDRLLVIGDGQIVASGTEAELVSRLMSGEQLEVTVRPKAGEDRRQIEAWLGAIDGVSSVTDATSKRGDEQALTFAVTTERDIRAELSRAIVEHGHGLLAIGRSERELESVFSKLAKSESLRPAAESEAA